MENQNFFSIESQVVIKFSNPNLCNIAYQSFLPDFNTKLSPRSKITMDKNNSSLIFNINSNDITAFRASINEIINNFRIFDHTLEIYNPM
ncbi:MAG: CTAG/PCC1 family protein [Candidatus Lokiarchaeota archaeon]|nr:CTAG/PCC1 family protein [Candidatus Lokiarchaeota archaeon]